MSTYRYGFNGMEMDNEVNGSGSSYTADFWQYDARLGRRWNVDPVVKPWESPYACFNNNPLYYADPLGLDGDPKPNEKGHVYDCGDGTIEIFNGEKYERPPGVQLKGVEIVDKLPEWIKAGKQRIAVSTQTSGGLWFDDLLIIHIDADHPGVKPEMSVAMESEYQVSFDNIGEGDFSINFTGGTGYLYVGDMEDPGTALKKADWVMVDGTYTTKRGIGIHGNILLALNPDGSVLFSSSNIGPALGIGIKNDKNGNTYPKGRKNVNTKVIPSSQTSVFKRWSKDITRKDSLRVALGDTVKHSAYLKSLGINTQGQRDSAGQANPFTSHHPLKSDTARHFYR